MNSVRIIGGHYRRRILRFPDSEGLRPTPEIHAVVDWLVCEENCIREHVMVLFAVSGALGFEALSRGAARVVMVEPASKVIAALHENAKMLENPPGIEIIRGDALQYLASTKSKFDLIFLDPPFDKGWIPRLEPLLAGVANEGAAVYIEAEHEIGALDNWRAVRHGKAGEVHFQLMRRETG